VVFACEIIFLDRSPGGHSNAFEKRSDEDLRTRGVFASLRAIDAEA
jgi:hypothetical protein